MINIDTFIKKYLIWTLFGIPIIISFYSKDLALLFFYFELIGLLIYSHVPGKNNHLE